MSKILLLLTLLFPVIFTYGQSIPATKSSIVSVRVKEYNKLIKNAKLKHLKKKYLKASKDYIKALELCINRDTIDWIKDQIILNNQLSNKKNVSNLDTRKKASNLAFDYGHYIVAYNTLKIDSSSTIFKNKSLYSKRALSKFIHGAIKHKAFASGNITLDTVQHDFPKDSSKFFIELRSKIALRKAKVEGSIKDLISKTPNYNKTPEQDLRDSLRALDSLFQNKILIQNNFHRYRKFPLHVNLLIGNEIQLPEVTKTSGNSLLITSDNLNLYQGIEISLGRLGATFRYGLSMRLAKGNFSTYYHDALLERNIKLERFEYSSKAVGFNLYITPFKNYFRAYSLGVVAGVEYHKFDKLMYTQKLNTSDVLNQSVFLEQTRVDFGLVYAYKWPKSGGMQVFARYSYGLGNLINNRPNSLLEPVKDSKLNTIKTGLLITIF
ncbi:hypothetical protein GOQ04_00580 [Emticicia sp. ODNR4P]|nr:hypothetical protein [Emticicia sp. ODNR4P]